MQYLLFLYYILYDIIISHYISSILSHYIQFYLPYQNLIFLKRFKVSDFGQCSLQSVHDSNVEINPQIPEGEVSKGTYYEHRNASNKGKSMCRLRVNIWSTIQLNGYLTNVANMIN